MPQSTRIHAEKKARTCVVVEDLDDVREVLCGLAKLNGLHVAGEAGDGHAGLETILRCKPDLVIVDLMLPLLKGSDVIKKSRCKLPNTRFLVITGYGAQDLFTEAVAAGANAYLMKPPSPEEFAASVVEVLEGRPSVSPQPLKILWDTFVAQATPPTLNKLSPRQMEVVELVSEGFSNKEIAHKLGISVRTVEKHRADAIKCLGARSTGEMVRLAGKLRPTT